MHLMYRLYTYSTSRVRSTNHELALALFLQIESVFPESFFYIGTFI